MEEYIKILRSDRCDTSSITLIISNNEMEDIIKIVKSVKDSGLLLKGVTESVQNEIKEQKGGFFRMLLANLGATLLGNILSGQGIKITSEGIVRAGYGHHSSQNKNNKMSF